MSLEHGIPHDRDVVYFGRANFRNANRLFGVKRKDRRQHMYVVGKTGTGKTSLIHNMIVQDIANGEGVCVVDPHGELIEEIVREIPPERVADVIYFNPADTDYYPGFNVLELPDPRYKHLVASGLMGIFTKIWSNVWSARMEYILNNAILALLDTPGSTLLGVTRILVDKEYRQRIVGNIKDPVVRAFWIHEYEEWQDKFRNEAIAPIQNKVGQFLSTAIIRNVVGQSKSTIDIFDIMNRQKIFLVNVSKGRIGEDNSALLGAMLITKIQLAAMERVRIQEDERKDFYLYVDEFQNFATDSFAGILSEARKYRLNLIIAHQYTGQLVSDASTKVRDAVFGNVGTMILFRVGAGDAEFLENEFSPEFMPPDLVQLPNHCIYLKLMVDGITSRPFSAATLPPFHLRTDVDIDRKVIESSRRLYTRPAKVVEEEILRWSGMGYGGGEEQLRRERRVERVEGAMRASSPISTPVPRDSVQISEGAAKPSRRTNEREYAGALADLGIEFAPASLRSPAAPSAPAPRPFVVPTQQRVSRDPSGDRRVEQNRRMKTAVPSPMATPTVVSARPALRFEAGGSARLKDLGVGKRPGKVRNVQQPHDRSGLRAALSAALGSVSMPDEKNAQKPTDGV